MARSDDIAKVEALREHLAEGADQAGKGHFVDGYSADRLIADLDREGRMGSRQFPL